MITDIGKNNWGETTIDTVANDMVSNNRDSGEVKCELSPIIGEIAEYLVKSINFVLNGLTLMKRPDQYLTLQTMSN